MTNIPAEECRGSLQPTQLTSLSEDILDVVASRLAESAFVEKSVLSPESMEEMSNYEI